MTGPRIGPPMRVRVVELLRRASGPRTAAEIAQALSRRTVGITTLLKRLEADGVIYNDAEYQARSANRGCKYWRLVGETNG